MMTIFEALADPTRRRILDLLREQPRLVGELTELLQISQPGVSKQLHLLREVGLVTVRQDAQRDCYVLRPEPLAEIDTWLNPYRQVAEQRYDRLGDLLDAMQAQQKEEQHDEDDPGR